VGTPLSPPQRQILALLAAGLRNDQIAELLGIRPATVHHYLDALYRKLDVHSRTQALARAAELDLDLPRAGPDRP